MKKIPMRKCLGCMESFDKRTLIRVVKTKEDEFSVDFTGKKNGRGAYICKSLECFLKAKKAKRFERAFERQVPEEVYERLEGELLENG